MFKVGDIVICKTLCLFATLGQRYVVKDILGSKEVGYHILIVGDGGWDDISYPSTFFKLDIKTYRKQKLNKICLE